MSNEKLIEKGKQILLDMGYKEEEIHNEYQLPYILNKQTYTVDIGAVSKEMALTVVECGDRPKEKINALKKVALVIHLQKE